jgi:hypothetical protein
LGKGKEGEKENERNEEEVKGMRKNSRRMTEAEDEKNKIESESDGGKKWRIGRC